MKCRPTGNAGVELPLRATDFVKRLWKLWTECAQRVWCAGQWELLRLRGSAGGKCLDFRRFLVLLYWVITRENPTKWEKSHELATLMVLTVPRQRIHVSQKAVSLRTLKPATLVPPAGNGEGEGTHAPSRRRIAREWARRVVRVVAACPCSHAHCPPRGGSSTPPSTSFDRPAPQNVECQHGSIARLPEYHTRDSSGCQSTTRSVLAERKVPCLFIYLLQPATPLLPNVAKSSPSDYEVYGSNPEKTADDRESAGNPMRPVADVKTAHQFQCLAHRGDEASDRRSEVARSHPRDFRPQTRKSPARWNPYEGCSRTRSFGEAVIVVEKEVQQGVLTLIRQGKVPYFPRVLGVIFLKCTRLRVCVVSRVPAFTNTRPTHAIHQHPLPPPNPDKHASCEVTGPLYDVDSVVSWRRLTRVVCKSGLRAMFSNFPNFEVFVGMLVPPPTLLPPHSELVRLHDDNHPSPPSIPYTIVQRDMTLSTHPSNPYSRSCLCAKSEFFYKTITTHPSPTTVFRNGNWSQSHTLYFPVLELDAEWKISIMEFVTCNSVPNIDMHNQSFMANIGEKTYKIVILVGLYELDDLETFIKVALPKDVHFQLHGNPNMSTSTMYSNTGIDFSEDNSIAYMLVIVNHVDEIVVPVVDQGSKLIR
ncbi:hypothetical protein PR048_019321 [Dryococelus australis]|uniref:BTB domain-containing protein n=1 Tax=Dryococelus australis TaxID=614101 RepID=A0ABQ9H391_9NEOP|nr:hypothetical protein PR048_019321 [Dryococelus australis]